METLGAGWRDLWRATEGDSFLWMKDGRVKPHHMWMWGFNVHFMSVLARIDTITLFNNARSSLKGVINDLRCEHEKCAFMVPQTK